MLSIISQIYKIDREKSEKISKQKNLLALSTGLSGSGKSSLANSCETELHDSSDMIVLPINIAYKFDCLLLE